MPYSYAALVERKKAKYFARKCCPICGRPGCGPHVKRVKGHDYLYFANSLKNPETGKHYQKWHYVGPALAIESAGGIPAYLERIRSQAHVVS